MKLTKSQLEKIIKEETIEEVGWGRTMKKWAAQEKEDAEWPELAATDPPDEEEKGPLFSFGAMKKAVGEEEKFGDMSPDARRIAIKFEVTKIAKVIGKMVDKKVEFMQLMQYAIFIIKQDDVCSVNNW